MSALRFRRFRTRVLALVLGLLFVALGATYLLVARANRLNALEHAKRNLELGAHVFDQAVQQRIDQLTRGAQVLATDSAIKSVLAEEPLDRETLADALESYSRRIGSPVLALLDPKGRLLANSDRSMPNENLGPFAYLIEQAAEQKKETLHGFGFLNEKLHLLVVVPLYAPRPNVAAWFSLSFPIDEKFADDVKATSLVELTFVADENSRVLASTMPPAAAALAAQDAARQRRMHTDAVQLFERGRDRFLTLFKSQELLAEDPVTIVLQRSLRAETEAARLLERTLLSIALGALALAAAAGFWIARGVSQPVLALAEHTRHIAAGDYERRIDLAREDELGQLAQAFNAMSAGLAERDRVRDLLDKNVSPEVAAQLLRDGAALGGEEREVTILFADLRGFTTLSEQLSPHALLTLLNRYLDRMSAAIERHGGVIDKFIGDEVMALFGAPLAQRDSADRALAAAVAMRVALAELNRELAAEGRPALANGIGVNTARVVAGNIGSHRRLNYSVIGDGVNIAARLQTLTRNAAFGADVITSAATRAALREPAAFSLRALGTVPVKGRSEPVEIFAVELGPHA